MPPTIGSVSDLSTLASSVDFQEVKGVVNDIANETLFFKLDKTDPRVPVWRGALKAFEIGVA